MATRIMKGAKTIRPASACEKVDRAFDQKRPKAIRGRAKDEHWLGSKDVETGRAIEVRMKSATNHVSTLDLARPDRLLDRLQRRARGCKNNSPDRVLVKGALQFRRRLSRDVDFSTTSICASCSSVTRATNWRISSVEPVKMIFLPISPARCMSTKVPGNNPLFNDKARPC